MLKIDLYLNEIFKDIPKNQTDYIDIREEMKSHLIDQISAYKEKGYNEEESIKLAIKNFGNAKFLGNELKPFFEFRNLFAGKILITAIVFLLLSLILFFLPLIKYEYTNVQKQLEFETKVNSILEANNSQTQLSVETKKALSELADNRNFISLAVFTNGIHSRDWDNPKELNPIFQYPNKYNPLYILNNYNNSLYETGGTIREFKTSKSTFSVGYMESRFKYSLLYPLSYGIFLVYWILFGIWASIKSYSEDRLNKKWFLAFLCLNVLGYLIYYKVRKPVENI